jgi:ParB/RepB/Spo0J family partition protein
MSVNFDVKAARNTEYGFFPDELEVLPELNGRHELPDIQWIVDSIIRHGQLQPVTIRQTAKKPVLVAGFSRWRAVAKINKEHLTERPLRLRCSYTALTEKQAFMANVEENRVRNATTPIDDAYNIQRMVNVYGMTEKEVAETYRVSVAWVKGRLQLIELTPEAEKAYREGRIAGPAAKEIAKLSRDMQKKIVAESKDKKITKSDVSAISGKPAASATANNKKIEKLAGSLFKSMSKDDIQTLSDDAYECISVDRKTLLALYQLLYPTPKN